MSLCIVCFFCKLVVFVGAEVVVEVGGCVAITFSSPSSEKSKEINERLEDEKALCCG